MTTNTWRWFGLLVVVAMIAGTAAMTVSAQPAPAHPEAATGAAPVQQPPPPSITRTERISSSRLVEVPPEIVAEFADGMTVEEFIRHSGGRIPRALETFVDRETAVIIELESPPLAVKYARAVGTMSTESQKAYLQQLKNEQARLEPQLQALGVRIISRYQKVYNGFLARVPFNKLAQIRALDGVKSVYRAPLHYPDLAASVPLIRADQVWSELGYDGNGVTVAVIDSGIDYYHAALGGSGNPNDYANDDHEVIEPGTFPTSKVIGGYDFAGPNYDASSDNPSQSTPQPDPDPIDGDGHGTHVASTIAGIEVSGVISPGVAPAAQLYALKVFGEPAGSTNLVIDAIEWAMDPNGDGDLSDHVDVINMSLGAVYGPADPNDPELVVVNNASDMGVIVVASAGNAGDTPYIHGTPAAADTAIAVAASTTGYATGPTINISGTTSTTQTNIIYQPPAFDNNTGHFTESVTATLAYVGSITTTDTLCSTDGITQGLTGTVALIQRGDCPFSQKVNNAAALGAVGAIIFNSATGGNTRVTMAGDPVNIPAGFIARQDGLNLIPANGQVVIVSAENEVQTLPDPYTPADSIATFSSRGPRGFDSMLKPDVTAPGVGIFAAAMGTGDGGVSYSGTSMAAPHVAGAAALVRQAHPEWTPEQVKAALMNTAVDLVGNQPLPRQGAGRIDVYRAASTETVAVGDKDLVSLNWGVLPIETDTYMSVKLVTLRNFASTTKVYSVTWSFGPQSETAGVGLSVPPTVTVGPMNVAAVPVTLNIDATQLSSEFQGLEEYYGYVVFTNIAMLTDTLRVPFYLIPRPYTRLTELASQTTFDYSTTGYAWFRLRHTGPISSSLWVYPVFAVDNNETHVGDEGDVRLVGMDYGGSSSTYGDIFIPAINTWGAWHTPQPYFAEFDLYLDVDNDGGWDLVDFNWNYGAFSGGTDTDMWVVVQVDLATGEMSLASPYLIYTDYNAGFMEWYLPATWNGLSGTDTDFRYQLFGFDYRGNSDETPPGSFDYAKPPFWRGWSSSFPSDPGPYGRETLYAVGVNDLGGYLYSQPKGAMIVDYNGKPGQGQAYYWPLTVTGYPKVYLPLVLRAFGP